MLFDLLLVNPSMENIFLRRNLQKNKQKTAFTNQWVESIEKFGKDGFILCQNASFNAPSIMFDLFRFPVEIIEERVVNPEGVTGNVRIRGQLTESFLNRLGILLKGEGLCVIVAK